MRRRGERPATEMNEESFLEDRIRALVHGTLSEEDAEQLKREIESDAEASVLLHAYRDVYALTAAFADDVHPSSVSVRDVLPKTRIDALRSRWRSAVAAVLVLGVAALAAWHVRSPGEPELLELAAIPLGDLGVDTAPRTVPAALQWFTPTTTDGVRWMDSLTDALEIAAVVDRPVLLFGGIRGCSYCMWMDANTFGSDAVLGRFAEFVPVRLTAAQLRALAPDERPEMLNTPMREWPIFAVMDSTGRPIANFAGLHSAEQFRERLDDSLIGVENDPISWKTAGDLTNRFLSAEAARADDRFAEAWTLYCGLAVRLERPFAGLGAWGRDVLARDARRRLDEARAAAEPERSRELLDNAARAFAGTPLGDELARVRDSFVDVGAFPELKSAR